MSATVLTPADRLNAAIARGANAKELDALKLEIGEEQKRINTAAIQRGARENPIGMHSDPAARIDAGRSLATPVLSVASSITTRELEPVWDGVLWIGKPTMIVGDPGLGKSVATCDVAARVSTGDPWPCSTERREPGSVLMLSGEDDPEDTIVPRLIAAGADLARITFLRGVREANANGHIRHADVSLDQHIDPLRAAITSCGGIRLLIVDPISAFLGRADSHNNAEVRAVLGALGRLSSELRFAVLVVSHLNKMSGANAVYRITGSLGFVAAARAVFAIVRDPEEGVRRLMLPVKSNLGPDSKGYAYTIGVADNGSPRVRWADDRVTKTADEILGTNVSPRKQAVIDRGNDVQDWLRNKLVHGPVAAAGMWSAAEDAGYSRRDIDRAKRALGVIAEIKGFRGAWHWSLPTKGTP